MSVVPHQTRAPWLRELPCKDVESSSLEDELSRAIESSDECALSLLREWGTGVLAGLETDTVSDL